MPTLVVGMREFHSTNLVGAAVELPPHQLRDKTIAAL
jgi:hypothetical protein